MRNRKRFLVWITFLLIVTLGLSGCSQSKSPAAVPALAMFQGNQQHTGFYSSEGPGEFHGVKWKFNAGDKIRSSPIAMDNVIYFGSDNSNFYAVDAETGQEKWHYKTEGAIKSSPAVFNGSVYFLSTDGYFYALSTKNGELVWKYKTEGEYSIKYTADFWQSSPAIDNGTVYFGGEGSFFYALNASDGKEKWKLEIPPYDIPKAKKKYNPTIHTSPAILDGTVFIATGFFDNVVNLGNIVAVDEKDGKIKWTSNFLHGCVDSSPLIAKDRVYFGTSNDGLYALDVKTGKSVWSTKITPFNLGTMATYNNVIFSGSSDFHKLYALDADTGKGLWNYSVVGAIHASVITDGKTVYCATGNHYSDTNYGVVYAVDANTGKEKWQFKAGGNMVSTPTIYKGRLYIGSDDGNLYAIE